MERHKCKLCSRTFANGRALGGHMKAHLATLPLPPKPQPPPFTDSATSLSYSSSSESEQEYQVEAEEVAQRESDEKALIYGLRENPKKSFRIADPEFSFAPPDTGSSVVVQDRESETESKNPTRQRSKRNRKSSAAVVPVGGENNNNQKKPKLGFMVSTPPPPTTEPEPVSSVSDTSPEEDVAMCLMMLSRDRWWRRRNNNVVVKQEEEEEEGCDCEGSVEVKNKVVKLKRVRGKHVCDNCGKSFRSSRALGSHRSICCRDEADKGNNNNNSNEKKKIFECPFCFKVFGSGQALGGHKRSHLIPSSSSNTVANNNNDSAATRLMKESFIDLNLPAPSEEDDLSVVSDA